jgi:hypothetical protein
MEKRETKERQIFDTRKVIVNFKRSIKDLKELPIPLEIKKEAEKRGFRFN